MRLLLIFAMILTCLTGCRKQSGEDVYKRIKGSEVFSADSAYVSSTYRDALVSSQNNERASFTELDSVARVVKSIQQHKSEYPQVESKYEALLKLIDKWPVYISQTTVFLDSCTREVIRKRINQSRWVEYGDYIADRSHELSPDTLLIGCKRASALRVPAVPYIQKFLCPFEGCQYGRWIAGSLLKVYPHEGDTSEVAFTIAPGDTFIALTGNIHMDRLGVVVVTKPYEQFSPGDTVYTLSYTGEGSNDIWYRGQELNVEIFWPTDHDIDFATINVNDPRWNEYSGVMVTPPLMVWWVRVAYRNGQKGWLSIVNRTLAGFGGDDEIHGMDSLE